jgi:hypothetical protein
MKEKIADYLDFAENKHLFLQKMDEYVKAENYLNNIPDSIISSYSWDSLFNKMKDEINHSLKIEL